MGTAICQNCNSSQNMYLEKNLSTKNFSENEDNNNQFCHLIQKQNKLGKFDSNNTIKINNNENENNISNYDNPLYNTSLDESLNLGNCYIGTNKNYTKIKQYNPDNTLRSIMNRKRLSIEEKPKEKENILDKKMNKTSKNFYKKNIGYNLLLNEESPEKDLIENGFYYNNSNKKNNLKYNNMGFYNNSKQNSNYNNSDTVHNNNTVYNSNNNEIAANNNNKIDNNFDNINKFVKNINNFKEKNKIKKNNQLNDKQPEINEEVIIDKLHKIFLKYNIKLLRKIYFRISKNKLNNKDNNLYEEEKEEIFQYNEEDEMFNDELIIEDSEVNLYPENKHIFIGSKINNLKEGNGLEIFKNANAYYFGQFIKGKRFGYCKYTINNKNNNYIYKGEVDGIYANGYGHLINYETNLKYEGEWKNSLKDGIGIETYQKNYYQGDFKNGKRNGIGEYFWEKDVFYSGEWNDNCMNGEGIYYFSKDAWYEGSFYSNKMEGFGILNVNKSKIYVGFFKNDYKNGFGIKIWDNDKKAYVGFWKNNKQDGFGKSFKKDKIKYGIYQDGIIINEIKESEKINKIYNDINKYFSLLFELRNYNEVKSKVYEYINM